MPQKKTLKELLAEKHKISEDQMAAKDKIDREAGKQMKEIDGQIKARIDEELHEFWERSLRPKLTELHELVREGIELFSDYTEEFESHVRGKKAEVADDQLLAEIYGATLKSKNADGSKKNLTKQAKINHVIQYDQAKKFRKGAEYLRENDLNSNNIATWRRAFLAALEMTDKP